MIDAVLLAIDMALADAESALEIDKLVAARQCLLEPERPTLGTSTTEIGDRRAFVKWCPKCESALPCTLFNRNRRQKDGRQSVCRECQRRIYQEHCGELARSIQETEITYR